MKDKIIELINDNTTEVAADKILKLTTKPRISRKHFFHGESKLWQERHKEESERLQKILIEKGFTSCSIGEAEGLWMVYSGKLAAGFLGMPDSDQDLYECIKDQLCVVESYNIG